ncbi:MAG: glutamate racemase [Chitinophagaceae bacterium]|nr:glutamate racemase [Chitinophagaceae bacterium]
MRKKQPIGIFDSGIGGLTVAKAISQLLPEERMIYFGDTEHMPYGGRSAEHILQYSLKITEFLIAQGAKIIVIACNSASAVACLHLQEKYKGQIEVIGVIEPVTDYISRQDFKKVGIIGTKPTIESRAHQTLLSLSKPSQKIVTMATPLLAPMIEEGFFNNSISQTIVNSYLGNWRFKSIDALVLACTHYPLIKKEILKFYQKKIDIIDTSEIVAEAVKQSLTAQKLLNPTRNKADQFFVSEYTESFEKTTKVFYGTQVHIEEVRLNYETP